MSKSRNVLIAGRSHGSLKSLQAMLKDQAGISTSIRPIENGYADPLHDLKVMPDILVLQLDSHWKASLDAIMARPTDSRPVLLVTGPGEDTGILRHAMQAGARDYLIEPVSAGDFQGFMAQTVQELSSRENSRKSRIIAVINAKGGSGATFLASNLAHITAATIGLRVVALDLDMQFGTLPLYLDLNLRHSLLQALNTIDTLDGLALEAYTTSHASGLQVLGSIPGELVLPEEIHPKQVRKLLNLVEENYSAIFADLPKQIDRLTSMVMEGADQVVVVMQQSVTHLRDSKQLYTLLKRELGIPEHKILVVVNRYQPKNLLTLQDIERTLGCDTPVVIPNDFRNVNESVNTGIPLYKVAKSAAITKALVKLAERLSGSTVVKKPGLLRRTFSHLGRQ